MHSWHRTGIATAAFILAAAMLPAQQPDTPEPVPHPNILWQQRFAAPPLVRLSQDGQYLAYLVAGGTGVPVEQDELGLVSVADRRVVWTKHPPEGIRFSGGPVFDEQSHSLACSYYYLPEPGPVLPAEERGLLEFRGGIYVWSVDGELELNIPGTIHSPEPGAQPPFWPIFMDSGHIVAVQSVMEDVQGLFIFDREGNLLRQVGGEGQWVARQVAVSPDGSYLVRDGRDAIIMESMGGERLGSFPGHLFPAGQPITADGEYVLIRGAVPGRATEYPEVLPREALQMTVLDRRATPVWAVTHIPRGTLITHIPREALIPHYTARRGDPTWRRAQVLTADISVREPSTLTVAIVQGLGTTVYTLDLPTETSRAPKAGALSITELTDDPYRIRDSARSSDGGWRAYSTLGPAAADQRMQWHIGFRSSANGAQGQCDLPPEAPDPRIRRDLWQLHLSSTGRYAAAVAGSTAYLIRNPAMQEEPQ